MAIDTNEDRADRGMTAIRAAATQTGVWNAETAETAFTDVLSYIGHACDRLGLDPRAIFAAGLESYEGDSEDGPAAEKIADGTQVHLVEVCA